MKFHSLQPSDSACFNLLILPPSQLRSLFYILSFHVGAGCKMLHDAVKGTIQNGSFPLILGGDHSIAAGSLAGILSARPNTGVLWIVSCTNLYKYVFWLSILIWWNCYKEWTYVYMDYVEFCWSVLLNVEFGSLYAHYVFFFLFICQMYSKDGKILC